MKKTLKIFGITFLVIIILAGLAVASLFVFEKDIKNAAVNQLNSYLNDGVEIKVRDIKLSFFEDFPRISMSFSDLRIPESKKINNKDLLKAGTVFCSFNIWDIVSGEYKIIALGADNLEVYPSIDNRGNDNFSGIFKSNNNNQDTGTTRVDLKEIIIKKLKLVYTDKSKKFQSSIQSEKIIASAIYSDKETQLNMNGDLFFDSLIIKSGVYLRSRPILFDISAARDNEKKIITLNESSLSFSELRFKLGGSYSENGEYDLDLKGNEIKITELLQLIPPQFLTEIENIESEGNLDLHAHISGDEKELNRLDADFSIDNGKLLNKSEDVELKDIKLSGTLRNGHKSDKALLNIKNIKAGFNTEVFQGAIFLQNFENPDLKVDLQGSIDVGVIGKLFTVPGWNAEKGTLSGEFRIEGNLAQIEENPSSGVLIGALKLIDITLKDEGSGKLISELNGEILLDGKDLNIPELKGKSGQGEEWIIRGKSENLYNYIFGKNQTLKIKGDFASNLLIIDSWLGKDDSDKKSESNSAGVGIPSGVELDLKIDIDEVRWAKFIGKKIIGNAFVSRDFVKVENLKMNAMEGEFILQAKAYINSKNEYVVNADLKTKGVEISKLFYECNNFGQNEITDKNLTGKLQSEIQFASVWDKNFEVDAKRMYVFAKLKIEKGQLKNYEPLKSLSKFIKVSELENIQFATLENEIEIRDEKIFIPAMELKNNALNLFVEGVHSFENRVEYHLKIRLSELISAKYKKQKNLDEFEDDPQNQKALNLFILMKGLIDDLKITYDGKAARNKVKEDLKKEKQDLKEILKKEFGRDKPEDKPVNTDNEPNDTWEDDIPE